MDSIAFMERERHSVFKIATRSGVDLYVSGHYILHELLKYDYEGVKTGANEYKYISGTVLEQVSRKFVKCFTGCYMFKDEEGRVLFGNGTDAETLNHLESTHMTIVNNPLIKDL